VKPIYEIVRPVIEYIVPSSKKILDFVDKGGRFVDGLFGKGKSKDEGNSREDRR
jgi:hypothetical protein